MIELLFSAAIIHVYHKSETDAYNSSEKSNKPLLQENQNFPFVLTKTLFEIYIFNVQVPCILVRRDEIIARLIILIIPCGPIIIRRKRSFCRLWYLCVMASLLSDEKKLLTKLAKLGDVKSIC